VTITIAITGHMPIAIGHVSLAGGSPARGELGAVLVGGKDDVGAGGKIIEADGLLLRVRLHRDVEGGHHWRRRGRGGGVSIAGLS